VVLIVVLGAVAVAMAIALSLVLAKRTVTRKKAAALQRIADTWAASSLMNISVLDTSHKGGFGDNPATVVTSYYHVKGKASNEEYMRRMRIFFAIPCHLVIFTSPELVATMTALREPFANRTRVISMPFSELTSAQIMPLWKEHHEMVPHDVTYHIMSPDVYAIWAEKAYFLERAAVLNAFGSNALIWLDAGYFRDEELAKSMQTFPSALRIRTLNPTMVHFVEVVPFKQKDRGDPYSSAFVLHLAGGAIVVHRDNATKFREMYEVTRGMLVARGNCVRIDESVYNLMYLLRPDFVAAIHRTPWRGNGFFYLTWLLCDAMNIADDEALAENE